MKKLIPLLVLLLAGTASAQTMEWGHHTGDDTVNILGTSVSRAYINTQETFVAQTGDIVTEIHAWGRSNNANDSIVVVLYEFNGTTATRCHYVDSLPWTTTVGWWDFTGLNVVLDAESTYTMGYGNVISGATTYRIVYSTNASGDGRQSPANTTIPECDYNDEAASTVNTFMYAVVDTSARAAATATAIGSATVGATTLGGSQ